MSSDEIIFGAETDYGTVLDPKQVAIINDNEQGLLILMPKDGEIEINESGQAIVICAMRLQSDPEFLQEMLDYLED